MFRTAAGRCRAALAAILAVLVTGRLATPAWAVDPPPYERDWGPMWERGGWDGWEAHVMIFSPVFLLLIVAGLIVLGFAIYHSFHPRGLAARHSPVASGHRILAERFARGEIEEAEYRDKRRVLGKH
jgi:putative membrane protein